MKKNRILGAAAAVTAAALIGYIGVSGCLRINSEAAVQEEITKYYMPGSDYYYTDYADYLQAMEEREAYLEGTDEAEEEDTCTDQEKELLARIAMAEAEGEDTEGKALVIRVVLNRVESDDFPDTVEEVIYEEDQFTSVETSRWELEPDEDCWEALEMVLEGWDESEGALYFESSEAESWQSTNCTFLFTHGGHRFYI